MNRVLFVLFLLVGIGSYAQQQTNSVGFIENKGQIVDQKGKPNKAVKYLLNTNGLNVQLRKNGFSYDVYETKKHPLSKEQIKKQQSFHLKEDSLRNPNYTLEYVYHRIDIDFANCNPNAQLIPERKSTDYDNYYNIPSVPNGILDVHKFQSITYQNIYPNIDIVFIIPEDKSKPVEYNFIVKPGGKISDIQLKFNGAKTELIDNKIKMTTRFGQMEETLPLSWIENNNTKKVVAIGYRKIKNNVYGFETTENLIGKKVVIDPTPTRLWGTFYGGEKSEKTLSLEKDNQGNAYICGTTASKDFIATTGAHQSTFGSISQYNPGLYITDGFIAKFDINGNRLWSTFYGGINDDSINDISTSTNGLLGFCGNTRSINNIVTPGSFKDFKTGYDQITKMFFGILDSKGVRMWASYFGDSASTAYSMNAIVFDSNNDLYIGGETADHTYIATQNGYKNSPPTSLSDGFVSKFSSSGKQIWGTYYGGENADSIQDMVIDSNNNLIVVGYTSSTTGIASVNSFQQLLNNGSVNPNNYLNNRDGFIVSFSTSGVRNSGTYFGSPEEDRILRVKNYKNTIYIVGDSNSTDLATPNAFESINQKYYVKSFISKFSIQNQQKIWFSYSTPSISDFDINQNEEIYIVGNSAGDYIATPCSLYPKTAATYLRKINNNCQIIWNTYLWDLTENLYLRYINNDLFYVSGTYWGAEMNNIYDISTSDSYQKFPKGGFDSFINKFKDIATTSVSSSTIEICIGSTLNLTASGGAKYTWSGPNGFTSTQQNPTIPNATVSHSGKYTCAISGTGGCDNTIIVDVLVGDNTKPVPDIASLPTITGDCHTTITNIPTATDNCAGKINATTTDPLSYTLPGNYTINWSYSDGNGNTETQTQTVIINDVNLPTLNSPQTFCIQQNATINNIIITGQNIKWYDNQTGGNLLAASTFLQDSATYYASQTPATCESTRVPVTVKIQNTPIPTGNNQQTLCASQNPILSDIIINGNDIKWYDSSNNPVILPSTTILADGATYYASQTINGCESVNRLAVRVSLITSLNAQDYSETICDKGNDGAENVILSDFNSFLLNPSGNTFTYYTSLNSAENEIATEQINANQALTLGLNSIYVRINSSNGCHQIVHLLLTLVSEPVIAIPDEVILCEKTNVTVNAGAGFDSYLWSTGQKKQVISINQPGNYSVTVTKNHGSVICSSTKDFVVSLSNPATITSIETEDWTDNQNNIAVNVTGLGNYEYSLDGENYQNSNIFSGLPNGNYTLYVKDENGCGVVLKKPVLLLNYPKFFTPNGDGFHDGWGIKYSQFEENFEVQIYDRYGKLVKTMANKEAWDGTYNGKLLPADDYWFYITRNDGQIHKGHFTLKR